MATKLLKVIQRESGPFNPANNLLSIDFEPGTCTNLSKSYLDFEVQFSANGQPIPSKTILLGNTDTAAQYSTASLVKHATLRSDTVGLIEQQRFNNVYVETMKQFMQSSESFKSSVAFGNGELKTDTNGVAHMIVPLDKLLGAASSEQLYPDYRLGTTRLELELEDRVNPFYTRHDANFGEFDIDCEDEVAVDGSFNTVTPAQKFSSLRDAMTYFVIGREYTLNYTDDAAEVENVAILAVAFANGEVTLTIDALEVTNENITNISIQTIEDPEVTVFLCESRQNATASATNVNVITAVDSTLNDFVTGDYISVGYLTQLIAGPGPTDVWSVLTAKITDKVQNPTNPANIDITLDSSISIPAQSEIRDVFIFSFGEQAPVTWSVTECNLIQAKLVLQENIPQFAFKTNLLENVNYPAVSEFRRQVDLDAGCDLVTAININNSGVPLLGSNVFDVYRNSVNSVDTITKDVEIDYSQNGSLYFDRLITCLDDIKRLNLLNGEAVVVCIPEKIEPEQALVPNNVVEYKFRTSDGAPVEDSGMLYFYKRMTKVF